MNFWQKLSDRLQKMPVWPIGLGIGVLFLMIGFGQEQLAEMYRKAVMICLECIGIG